MLKPISLQFKLESTRDFTKKQTKNWGYSNNLVCQYFGIHFLQRGERGGRGGGGRGNSKKRKKKKIILIKEISLKLRIISQAGVFLTSKDLVKD